MAAGEAGACLHMTGIMQAYQADLLKDLSGRLGSTTLKNCIELQPCLANTVIERIQEAKQNTNLSFTLRGLLSEPGFMFGTWQWLLKGHPFAHIDEVLESFSLLKWPSC